MSVFKTYNLKLSEKSYFKLQSISIQIEKKLKKKMTKNEIIEKIINEYK